MPKPLPRYRISRHGRGWQIESDAGGRMAPVMVGLDSAEVDRQLKRLSRCEVEDGRIARDAISCAIQTAGEVGAAKTCTAIPERVLAKPHKVPNSRKVLGSTELTPKKRQKRDSEAK